MCISPKYIVHHVNALKVAIELSDLHNVNKGLHLYFIVSKQYYRIRINALFILKDAERL